jgi:hypothetical protein
MSSLPTVMPPTRAIVPLVLAMLAFAGNSLICLTALKHTSIDNAIISPIPG